MLPLTFANPADYDRVQEDDRVSIVGLTTFAPGAPLRMILKHADGSVDECLLNHTFNQNQIEWFKAGSALNLIAAQSRKSPRSQGKKTKVAPGRRKTSKKPGTKRAKKASRKARNERRSALRGSLPGKGRSGGRSEDSPAGTFREPEGL